LRFASNSLLALADFRRLGAMTLLTAVGMMSESVVLGWLTLELTDSPFLVGVAMGARALPLFFVGAAAGALADRVPRHRLLIATSVGQALTAGSIGALTLAHVVTLSHVLLLTFAAGCVRAVEHAARQSYAHDVVGAERLRSGFAVLGVAMRSGWLVGSLGAGAVIAHLGSGIAYLAVAGAFVSGAFPLLGASAPTHATPPSESIWRGVTGFFAVVRTERVLLVLMILTAGAEVLGFSHAVLLPSLARDVLHVGPEGLGTLNAARAVGGILALLAVTMLAPARGAGAFFIAILVSFGAGLIGLGVAPRILGYAGVIAVVIVVNAVGALADLLAQSLMQLTVADHLRGRAGGAWVVAIGLAPLGHLQIGALASAFGVGIALGTSGLGLVALTVGTALAFPRVRRL
jgi:MFS family permease